VRFWDTSAILPLLIEQPSTERVLPLIDEVPDVVMWWGTPVECVSAVARLRREDSITADEEARVLALLDEFRATCIEVQPYDMVRKLATRILRMHVLRAADALQLAAALVWAGVPHGDVIVTLDSRLAHAARLEGFHALP
jgi:uncharacterized protein